MRESSDKKRLDSNPSLGWSDWVSISQQKIDAFAELTGDRQAIHVDPLFASQTSIGETVAHGYLTLSLLPAMMFELLDSYDHERIVVNYGIDSLRFLSPVRVGSKVRLNLTVDEVLKKNQMQRLVRMRAYMELHNSEKPAFVSTILMLFSKH